MSPVDPGDIPPLTFHLDEDGIVLEGPTPTLTPTQLIVAAEQVPPLVLALLSQATMSAAPAVALDADGTLRGTPLQATEVGTFVSESSVAGLAIRIGSTLLPIAIPPEALLTLAQELGELGLSLTTESRA